MTRKVFNVEGGKHSSAAFAAFENRAYGSCVASPTSFVVSAGSGMNVSISAGDGLISVDNNTAKRVQSDATETVAVSSASASFNRIDSVVAYFDTGVAATQTVIDNVNNMFKFAVVAGTAAATPAAPTAAAIQAAIGAGKPYMVLYNVTVPQNATNLTGATFTDVRKVVGVIMAEQLPTDIITTPKIKNQAVTSSKLDFTTLAFGNYSTAEVDTGFKWLGGKTIYKKTINFGTLPDSTTKSVPHGIANLELVIGVQAMAKFTSGNQLTIPFSSPTASAIEIVVGNTTVDIITGSNRTSGSAYVTIYYTKA